MFDPMYDCYGSMARRAGGIVKAVKLKVEDWSVDRSHLQDAFSAKTKLVVVNTPHNPTGKVFSKDDLQFIADLCIQYNTYVLLDEVYISAPHPADVYAFLWRHISVPSLAYTMNRLQVYEHLVFEGSQHVSLRSLPGMQERSIRIGSAGKTFSFTAWKVTVLLPAFNCHARLTIKFMFVCKYALLLSVFTEQNTQLGCIMIAYKAS